MPTPKSVIKKINVKEGGSLEFEQNFDACQYYLFELSRAALRDVGKYVRRLWQSAMDGRHPKRTGKARKATKYSVWSSRNTKYPRVEIGLDASADGFYSYFQEFGSSRQPREGILTNTVQSHIAEIVNIESQYLSGLSGEAAALEALISEEDYDDEN